MDTNNYLTIIFLLSGFCLGALGQGNTLDEVQLQKLTEATKINPAFRMLDVQYTEEKIILPERWNKKSAQIKQTLSPDKHDLENVSVRPESGAELIDNKWVMLSQIRTRIDAYQGMRTDFIRFSNADKQSSPVINETQIQVGLDRFYRIDNKKKSINIYDRPAFGGIRNVEMLVAGNIIQYRDILSDIRSITRTVDSKEAKKEFRINTAVDLNGVISDQLICVNPSTGKIWYKLFVNPDNWGLCYKVIWYDIETGFPLKSQEFKNWIPLPEQERMYPTVIITEHFDDDADFDKEILTIQSVTADIPLDGNPLKVDFEDFKDYTITE